jgi:bifunctional DNase/RNase
MDARPSDAIALALRLDCPIFVERRVLDLSASATVTEPDSELDEPPPTGDDWPELIG